MYWCSLDILFTLHSPQQAHLHLQIILPPTWHGLWKQYFHLANSLFTAYWQSPFEYLFHSHLNRNLMCPKLNISSLYTPSPPSVQPSRLLAGFPTKPHGTSICPIQKYNQPLSVPSPLFHLIQEFLPLILIIRMALYLWSFTPNFSLLPYPPFTQLSR